MASSPNPRVDPNCDECPGQFEYQGQVKDGRGNPASLFECNQCGREVRL